MELRVLQYFLAVAKEENIAKAASLLHITQPTLSRQLMQLEKELGIKLFRRGKHRILLTEDGMLLRRRAQEIVDLAEKATKELMYGEEAVSGEITIGCGLRQSIYCSCLFGFLQSIILFHVLCKGTPCSGGFSGSSICSV